MEESPTEMEKFEKHPQPIEVLRERARAILDSPVRNRTKTPTVRVFNAIT